MFQQDKLATQVLNYNCPLSERKFFIQGEKINQTEDFVYEYKNFQFPIKDPEVQFRLKKSICSMLNSYGGTIFLSIIDQTTEVVGMKLNIKNMDEIKLDIQKCIQSDKNLRVFNPDVVVGIDIFVDFLPIKGRDGNWISHMWMPIIHVKVNNPKNIYIFYHQDKNEAYQINEYCHIRKDGNCQQIDMKRMKDLLIQKMQGKFIFPAHLQVHLKKPVADTNGVLECMKQEFPDKILENQGNKPFVYNKNKQNLTKDDSNLNYEDQKRPENKKENQQKSQPKKDPRFDRKSLHTSYNEGNFRNYQDPQIMVGISPNDNVKFYQCNQIDLPGSKQMIYEQVFDQKPIDQRPIMRKNQSVDYRINPKPIQEQDDKPIRVKAPVYAYPAPQINYTPPPINYPPPLINYPPQIANVPYNYPPGPINHNAGQLINGNQPIVHERRIIRQ